MPSRLVGRPRTRTRVLVALTALAAILFLGALGGLADIPGYHAVWSQLRAPTWWWLLLSAAGVALAFGGYRLAYEGINRIEGGPGFTPKQLNAVVAAGFGGFVARGGAAIDQYALEAAGQSGREAKVRVYMLQALEHVPIALFGCVAGIVLLAQGISKHPPLDFVVPWAVLPPIGAATAVWFVPRYRKRWRDDEGWRGKVAVALDGIWLVWKLARERPEHGLAFLGMAIFWAADIFALWAGVAAFGVHRLVGAVVIAYLIGYALTRRSAPLGGAGFIETTLTLTLWDAGVPLAVAIPGVLVYRFFNLWAPIPLSFAALPTLRELGGDRVRDPLEPPRGAKSLRRLLTASQHEQGARELGIFVAVSALLAFAACLGIAWAAGFERVRALLITPSLVWFPIALAGVFASYVGYLLAYRETVRVERGPTLRIPHVTALVSAGFGLFIPRGGFAVDLEGLRDVGVSHREARVRVLALGALEYAVLGAAACGAAVFLLVRGSRVHSGLTWPWAIAVPAGFAVGFWAVRHAERLRGRGGWRDAVALGLDAVGLLRRIVEQPRKHGVVALLGMGLYWTADVFVLWATLHAFLDRAPSVPALILGYATGYALTRRTLPLAGAGVVEAFLPFALSWVSIPLAAAVLAVFAYRVFNLWLPLVPALLGSRALRARRDDARDDYRAAA